METKGIKLPSRGLVYGTALENVTLKTFRGKEERMLAEMSTKNFDRKFAAVMGGVLTGLDPQQLTLGDRSYLMCWQAVNSYTNIFPMQFNCGTCQEGIRLDVDLSALDVVELPEDYKEPFTLNLSGNGGTVNLRVLRVADEIQASEAEADGGQNWFLRFALSIVDERNVAERLKWLEELPARDVAAIRNFHERFFHGPRMETVYKCPHCEYRGRVRVPMSLALFFPAGEAFR